MNRIGQLNPYLKGVLLWVACLVLVQFGYDFFPRALGNLICAACEAVFQHMKAMFYAYLIVSGLEYALRWRRIEHRGPFVMSRLLTATFFPWIVFLVWYLAPAVYGPMPTIVAEIVYSNVMVVVSVVCCVIVERNLVDIPYARSFRVVIVGLFLLSLLVNVAFATRLPWADLFTPPPGW